MSKSKHNYIGITEEPNEMFGKVMSLSDDLMWNWFDLLSMRSNEEIQQLKKECEAGRNPRDAKVMLAKEIVTRFHNAEAADAAEQEFINRFRKGAVPENIPEVTLENGGEAMGILKRRSFERRKSHGQSPSGPARNLYAPGRQEEMG